MATVQQLQEVPFGALRSLLSFIAAPGGQASALPVRISSEYVREVADMVLAAEDLEDLAGRLDELAGDERFWSELPSDHPEFEFDEAADVLRKSQLDAESLNRVLGPAVTRRCKRGHDAVKRALLQVLGFAERLRAAYPDLEARVSEEGGGERSPLDIVYDLTISSTLRQFLLGMLRFGAASMAIARAEEHGERLDPWLALGLADAWAEGPEALAATVASPEAILSWFASVVGDTQTAKKVSPLVTQWVAEAEAAGKAVYYPLDNAATASTSTR